MERQRHQSLDSVEFTYDWYREFLNRLLDGGYVFRKFSDEVETGDVFLRHDVDLSVEDAVTLARLESDLGVEATYCFLLTSPLYNPLDRDRREQIHEIESLGHEVTLHFSTHEYWDADARPDDRTIEERVAAEQTVFDSILGTTSETVSFHVPPSWVLKRSFDGFRNTYAPEYFSDIGYVADSGQRWRDAPPTVLGLPESFQLLTHPGLWGERDRDYEARIKRSITTACSYASRKAHREFLQEWNG